MTQIVRTVDVDAPPERALDAAASFFRDRAPDFKVQAIGSTSAAVEVRYSLVDDWTHLVRRHAGLAFAWQPRLRAFPRFGATLTVRPHAGMSAVMLEGSYTPPGGPFGKLFDRLIGERLANRTMDALLLEIKDYIERGAGTA
jgi:hypothetical protein